MNDCNELDICVTLTWESEVPTRTGMATGAGLRFSCHAGIALRIELALYLRVRRRPSRPLVPREDTVRKWQCASST